MRIIYRGPGLWQSDLTINETVIGWALKTLPSYCLVCRRQRFGDQLGDRQEMITRICIFFVLVAGLAGATASMGVVLTEEASACQTYKTC